MKIYVASSWRNQKQPEVVEKLRSAGYSVYDFRNPAPGNHGFQWSQIDVNWQYWTPEEYRHALHHPLAFEGFRLDFKAMNECDICLGVQPFGRSASMEMGWFAGQGKKTILLLETGEPELMVKMFDHICINFHEVLTLLEMSGAKDE